MSLRVGVIGLGVMGADHARVLQGEVRGAHLAATCDPVGECSHRDPHEMIEVVDAVVIASPDATHADLALACLAAGKPVLCEKPLGATAAEAWRVVEAEVALGRRLVQVGYMRRFDPAYLAMKACDVGEPALLHNIHRNAQAPDWFVGAMPITNSLVHEIDISRWLLDDEITEARVVGQDPMLVTMQTAKGVLISTEVFMNAAYGYHVHAELVGRAGTVAMAQPTRVLTNRAGAHGHGYPMNWVPRFAEAYRAQMNAFVAGARSGSLAGASAWDGYAATAIAEQIIPGLASGLPQTITLPAKPQLYEA
ncbi:Gfo/Idh/MocA family oxidoreductase [Stagnihabitans tardus]|uniref:Gfo/Idh/MocA family oxidoreductase n=1 Tax=Stagnihabitans tardus TaxID=2699202 RepID=A0AAE5BWI1_9RHOB|nr:Gfo/Idh/MocA family oxidoreductase [Stagnihabitans tardus]NBZ89332.1 Gfo/Idh/MocA family oxidoreductase [Stagnihabitans tardus]